MLSCWGTGWQPPQKNTSLLNPDTCWLNPKPVPSSSFWHDFVSTLVLFATALSRDWTQAKWDESSNKHEKKITEQPGHSLVAGQEVIGSNWKIYFLPWKITNKINSLNFISSHEKIQFWEGNKKLAENAQQHLPCSKCFVYRLNSFSLLNSFLQNRAGGFGMSTDLSLTAGSSSQRDVPQPLGLCLPGV